jgi:starch synthase
MRVLFASAELAPFVKVGGLGDFTAGLVSALRRDGFDVEVLLPDYGLPDFEAVSEQAVDMPAWAGAGRVRRGRVGSFEVSLVDAPRLERSHPYLDREGQGWPDNDLRFMAFSAAIASWASATSPDVLHLNDWHTGATLGFLEDPPPSLFTIHNLAYQGTTSGAWLQAFTRRPRAYEWFGDTNPLTGAIALADRVVTVSPTFAAESLRPESGFGVDGPLRARGSDFIGILNGIDTDVWDPSTDPHLTVNYDAGSIGRKRQMRKILGAELGWPETNEPMIGMVTRLTDQKGVDLALDLVPLLDDIGARLVLLGSGERQLAESAHAAAMLSSRFVFKEGYDEGLSHRIFAGCDLYLMPSRFEPAGLTQMQAMRYGTIPVVTDVGGLHDTVVDSDRSPERGTGFVAADVTSASVGDALARAVQAWRSTGRRGAMRRRGMAIDWSWSVPASHYAELYREVSSARR